MTLIFMYELDLSIYHIPSNVLGLKLKKKARLLKVMSARAEWELDKIVT